MLNVLRVDIKRYLLSKGVIFAAFIISVLCPLFSELLVLGVAKAVDAEPVATMMDLQTYSAMAPLFLALGITAFLYEEFNEGIIRNKIISGRNRVCIFISHCLINSILAFVLEVVSVLSSVAIILILGYSYTFSFDEVVRYTLVAALAGVSVSVLYTTLFICFCNVKVAIVLPAGLAILARLSLIFILDALYTESGVPKVTGMTLKLYESIDRFSPFAHLTNDLRWDNASYLLGNGVLIAVSIIIGIITFSKKDLK